MAVFKIESNLEPCLLTILNEFQKCTGECEACAAHRDITDMETSYCYFLLAYKNRLRNAIYAALDKS